MQLFSDLTVRRSFIEFYFYPKFYPNLSLSSRFLLKLLKADLKSFFISRVPLSFRLGVVGRSDLFILLAIIAMKYLKSFQTQCSGYVPCFTSKRTSLKYVAEFIVVICLSLKAFQSTFEKFFIFLVNSFSLSWFCGQVLSSTKCNIHKNI